MTQREKTYQATREFFCDCVTFQHRSYYSFILFVSFTFSKIFSFFTSFCNRKYNLLTVIVEKELFSQKKKIVWTFQDTWNKNKKDSWNRVGDKGYYGGEVFGFVDITLMGYSHITAGSKPCRSLVSSVSKQSSKIDSVDQEVVGERAWLSQ